MAHIRHIWALKTKVNVIIKLLPEDLKKNAAVAIKKRTEKVTRRYSPADCAGRSQNLHSYCSPPLPAPNDVDDQSSLQNRLDALPENLPTSPNAHILGKPPNTEFRVISWNIRGFYSRRSLLPNHIQCR
ncbi:hypothetical protein LSH36_72g03099 [Paralvinella palmiformis]|uniref:Uncharacterized protein n=1 Tax=Paralvinella palmiformis TaxID=53620 RepID=A0AAD9K2U2_9ANNE|nr:hypothetical protein LSH36_72g03099 [Paralvinella palmiformis]